YVGLSNAVLLAQHNSVYALDINREKVEMINSGCSPIADEEIAEYLKDKKLDLTASTDADEVYSNADIIMIATPTDYDEKLNYFDTSSIEGVIEDILSRGSDALIVIRSTVPIGYTAQLSEKYGITNVIFIPEFLREGKALYDNLYPSRIVVGFNAEIDGLEEKARNFVKIVSEGSLKENIPTLFVTTTEAEAVKLFSNTYLALRIAYFNELDTYAQMCGLDSNRVIQGVCMDPRIGNYYNNPSFGYGGYCLPKDTMQMLANYKNIPQDIIGAITKSNMTRKRVVADTILEKSPNVVGIYRLIMKSHSDNYRQSAVIDKIEMLKHENIRVVIYEPTLGADEYLGTEVVKDLGEFKKISDVIAANRYHKELDDVRDKVYTRDLYLKD
ncbi:MAG: nucleotide sugar dehydrogenase, partial [Firmicutes bacterium]|nr:nucleotide sugar dehydrogenase [Bacillota bacterium]